MCRTYINATKTHQGIPVFDETLTAATRCLDMSVVWRGFVL